MPSRCCAPFYDLMMPRAESHIGTLREKPLHASLKRWYAEPGDRIEAAVDGYVIDLVRGELLIEIQTRGFASMKNKLAALLDAEHHIRIVHPVAVDRWIVKVGDEGTVLSRRRSPVHGTAIDVFSELVSFPHLVAHPHFEIDLISTTEEEYRQHTPGRSWRRKGWSVVERHLIEVLDSTLFRSVDDFRGLLPVDLPDRFTTADLADGLGCRLRTAQQMAYCLRQCGAIQPTGKQGNAIEYTIAEIPRT